MSGSEGKKMISGSSTAQQQAAAQINNLEQLELAAAQVRRNSLPILCN